MNYFGEWLREDLTRFAVIIALLLALDAVVLTVFGGVTAVIVVLVTALLAAVYVSGGSSR